MLIRNACRIDFHLEQATPMITMLGVHPTRLASPGSHESLRASPEVPMATYLDTWGNRCTRMVAPKGHFSLSAEAVVYDSGAPDPYVPLAGEHRVEDLPNAVLTYLLGSRYCETDLLSNTAWELFQQTKPGWGRVQAICDYVHQHIRFDYKDARATRTALEAWHERKGVCRDFTHLAIAFCRALNIPARYCTGYLGDIGMPPPYPPGDFAAWMEVWLGGSWHVFDPRNNQRRIGRILVARGRDAADVPLVHSFGAAKMTGFNVTSDEAIAVAA
jgi:transglutaminase-like putative cysteine protease